MRTCSPEWWEQLSAWHDGESSEREGAAVEAHLAVCTTCAQVSRGLQSLRSALRRGSTAVLSPRMSEIGDEARARARAPSARPARPRRALAGVGGLVALAAAAAVLLLSPSGQPSKALADELVTHHVGGFAKEKPCDYESSDPVAVRSWLEGQLGYGVLVPALTGAELLGGRLCHLGGRRTAALMYRTAEGPMTVFVPAPASSAEDEAKRLARDARHRVACSDGALGAQICATTAGGQGLLAVAATDADSLSAHLRSGAQ